MQTFCYWVTAKKALITYEINIIILLLYIAFISEEKKVDRKRAFLTKQTTASFIRDRRATLERLNEECSENEGCSYEEVSESHIPNVVIIPNIMSCYQE